MMIQEKMGVVRASCFMFLVVLLCGSPVISSGYRRRAENEFISKLVDPVTGEVNEDLAKLLWISCRVDLIHMKQVVKDLNLCLTEETLCSTNEISLRSQSWEGNIKKLDKVLHPHLKRTLMDCVKKSNLLFHITREEGGSHFTSYLESFFTRLNAPRRNLGSRLPRRIAEIPNPVSGPVSARAPAPVPVPDSAPAPAPAPVRAPIRAPIPVHAPTKPFFPVYANSPPKVDEASSATSGADETGQANNNNGNHKIVIIAVAVTAAVTFIVAALLFFFCMKCCWSGSAVGQNDERPLLSLSMSDYSIGSGNSVKGEKPFVYNSSHDIKGSALDGKHNLDSNFTSLDESSSLGAVGGQVGPPLKPPPGRVVATPPGMPPLKPPPGRVEPLPPEPPAYLRASASSTGPPPPAPVPPPRPPPVPPPSMKPSGSAGPPAPRPPPPPTPGARPGAPPPPVPKNGPAPPRPPPPLGSKVPRPPLGSKHLSNTGSSEGAGTENGAEPKTKLKPFFWDKVLANPDNSMVWHQIKSGSFQFNEEMIETLFGATDKNKTERKKESSALDPGPQFIQIIDSKKAQNLSIMLRALNATIEEVCDALLEGNELPVEFLQALLKMAPTSDEELKLRLFTGEISQLGPADRFLKVLVDVPFAFKRIEALLFMCTLEEEVTLTKESFQTLEVACKELRNSRLFLKLLEAVLKTGNRMNDGTFRGGAQAFKLDTLLKLADVKGVDGKTTLLHFVVQEIIRTEGVRAARAMRESQSFSSVKTEELLKEVSHDTEDHYRNLGLQVVSRLSSELENVKKASALDAEGLTGSVAKLNYSLLKTRNFLDSDLKSLEEDSGFHETLKSFVQNSEVDIKWLVEEEKRIMGIVKSTGDYFHGNAGKDEGLRLFSIVRDFLIILDKVCREVNEAQKKAAKTPKKQSSTASASSDTHQQSFPDPRQKLFPAIAERRMDDSSSESSDD